MIVNRFRVAKKRFDKINKLKVSSAIASATTGEEEKPP